MEELLIASNLSAYNLTWKNQRSLKGQIEYLIYRHTHKSQEFLDGMTSPSTLSEEELYHTQNW